jgi:epoxyqueuosine reductase
MAEGAQHRAHQRGFSGPQLALEGDHQARCERERQPFAEGIGRRGVGQMKTKLDRMQDRTQEVLKDRIRALGAELGFDAIGFARAAIGEAARQRLHDWLAAGRHGGMDYMARHAALRGAPDQLHAGAVAVITVRIAYWPHVSEAPSPEACLADGQRAYVSRYALGRDYHKTLRQRLARLADWLGADDDLLALAGHTGASAPPSFRACVDSAPVMEVELARQAGTGWRGKHTLLLTQQGSWHFLGEILTTLPIEPDAPLADHCGTCSACIDACPTRAIVAPYQVDARRCISYLTIEHFGPIPEEFRPLLGNRIYGCDDCQLVCPWNRFAAPTREADFAPRNGLDTATLVDLFAWSESDFDDRLADRLRALAAQHRGRPRQRPGVAGKHRGAPRTHGASVATGSRTC